MTYAKLKLAAGLVAACGVLTAGGVWAGGQRPAAPAEKPAAAAPAAKPEASAAQRRRSVANLEKLARAVADHEAAFGHYPTDFVGKDGKPALSWRVAVLPYMGYANLWRRFKLDEPWDSKANLELLTAVPPEYVLGIEPKAEPYLTYYQVFTGPEAAFRPGKPRSQVGITDGTANTFGVVEAGPPVPWTKPGDLAYKPGGPIPPAAWPFANVASVSTLDGKVHQVDPAKVPPVVWKAMTEANDGQVVGELPRVELVAETPEEKAELAKLKAEAEALVKELEAETAKTIATLKAGTAASRDPIFAKRVRDLLDNMVRSTRNNQKWLPEMVGAKPAEPPAKK